MTDQPRWPASIPWQRRGPGPGRYRPTGHAIEHPLAGLIPVQAGQGTNTSVPEARQWAERAFNRDYHPLQSRVRSVHGYWRGGVGRLVVSGGFQDGAVRDDEAGVWSIEIDINRDGTATAEISGVELDRRWRGRGTGRRWVADVEQALAGAGVQEVAIHDLSGGFWDHLGGYAPDPDGHYKRKRLAGDWADQISRRLSETD